MTWLAIVAIHTAANEPPKVRHVMNKIHRNVGELRRLGDGRLSVVADAIDDRRRRYHFSTGMKVLRCDEFCSSPDELSEARLRLYG